MPLQVKLHNEFRLKITNAHPEIIQIWIATSLLFLKNNNNKWKHDSILM